MQSRTSGRSPIVAAVLSFILPGLGQMYAGHVMRGFLWAIPQVALFAVAAGQLVRQGALSFGANLFLNPDTARLVAIILIALLVYRVLGMLDAYALARRGAPRRRRAGGGALGAGAVVLVALLIANVLGVGYAAASAWKAGDLVGSVHNCLTIPRGQPIPPECQVAASPGATAGEQPTDGEPTDGEPTDPELTEPPEETLPPTPVGQTPTPEPTEESPTPPPSFDPGAARWAQNGRLDLLLIGGDAGPGRGGIRTDTMIVLSVEVETAKAALYGIPRNMYNIPLPDESKGAFPCGCFPGNDYSYGSSDNLLNSLYKYALDNPDDFPGGQAAGFQAVSGAIAELLRVDLDGFAYVDLNGFIKIIDAIGGVTIDVPEPGITDDKYPREDGNGYIKLRIKPGKQHMDGTTALRFARTRHQDSDYGRMKRQQTVLTALRAELNVCSILPRVPALLDATKGAFLTDIPTEEFAGLLRLAGQVELDKIRRHYFNPPNGYDNHLDRGTIAKIRNAVKNGFDKGGELEEPQPTEPGGVC